MGRKKKPITGYGEGTIFFSNTQNKWMGQINIGRGDDGKMKRKTVYGKTADEVKSKLQQVRYDIFTGDFVHPSNTTFEQLEKQILDDKLAMNEIQEQTYHRHADIRITLDIYSNVFESFQTENVAKVDNYLSDLGIAI